VFYGSGAAKVTVSDVSSFLRYASRSGIALGGALASNSLAGVDFFRLVVF